MNIGEEILVLLRNKADSEFEYYNPNFLLAVTELIHGYYDLEDEVVDEWVTEMFGA